MTKELIKIGTQLSVVFIICSVISIFKIDKDFALANHYYGFSRWLVLRGFTEYWLIIFAVIIFVLLLFVPVSHKLIHVKQKLLILYLGFLCFLMTLVIKGIKIFFGRDWPQTWSGAHESLIVDNVFQFNILKSASWFGSFPSGHCAVCAFMVFILVILYQRYTCLLLSVIIVMVVCQTLLNYHFLGDCFAGVAIGTFFAYYGIALYLICCEMRCPKVG